MPHAPSVRVDKDMVKLAAHILATKETSFDPRKFKDEYEAALKKLVARKAKGHTIEPAEPPRNVVSLMDALRQSLGRKATRAPQKRKTRKATRARKAA